MTDINSVRRRAGLPEYEEVEDDRQQEPLRRQELLQMIETLEMVPQDWTVEQLVHGLRALLVWGDQFGWWDRDK